MQNQKQATDAVTSVPLPVMGTLVIYARVATPDKLQQRALQVDGLKQYALTLGFQEDQIIVLDQDRGVSGSIPLSDRRDPTLLQTISRGTIQAVLVANEERLFRHADASHVNSFIELCIEHGVFVVTPSMVYDFHNPHLAKLFRFKCVEASSYVAGQIINRLQAGRKNHTREMSV